jgi:hypothetical protein
MAAPLNPSMFVPIGVGALILWRMYSRMRRLVGRQRFSNVRPWITIAVFPILTALLAWTSVVHPTSPLPGPILALGGGLVVGIALGIYGLQKTRFEKTPQGLFYTPNAHVGIALSLLFAGRIIYRLMQVEGLGGAPPGAPGQYAATPSTLLIFGTLAGYYVAYAIGLLRWRSASEGLVASDSASSPGS